MPKKFSILTIIICLLLFTASKIYAQACGNGNCQVSQGESCSTCPADCGICPTPPPTPVPPTATPAPTSVATPAPTSISTPAPDSGQTQTSSGDNGSQASTPAPTPTPTPVPPTINPPEVPIGPTENTSPNLSGTFKSVVGVSRIEVSLDNGRSWFRASFSGKRYNFRPESLEDGNYILRARITDNLGRVAVSDSSTLIIDVLPPILGGSSLSLGSLNLEPAKNGRYQVGKSARLKFVVSTRGGVVKGSVKLGDQKFELKQIKGSELFYAEIIPEKDGEYILETYVQDGAGRVSDRAMGGLVVSSSGRITEKPSGNVLADAKVSIYYYESDLNAWILWNGLPYGQENPLTTDAQGNYSFMLPSGKYYVEINKKGYKKARSEIFSVTGTRLINFDFSVNLLRKINFPFFSFYLPSLLPPDSFSVRVLDAIQADGKASYIGKTVTDIQIAENRFTNTAPLKGKPALITFVSSWSNASQDLVLTLDKLSRENSSFNVLVVFLQDSGSTAASLIQRGKYSFDYVVDRNGYSADAFSISTLPQSFLINKDMIIKDIYYGVFSEKTIINSLNDLN